MPGLINHPYIQDYRTSEEMCRKLPFLTEVQDDWCQVCFEIDMSFVGTFDENNVFHAHLAAKY